ncbi:sn-glycerol-1-phosphate dehydrogenase [Opitutus sp. ER46]|uniref:sn-glycerol-1-phosphate dehydrogenase n=1 Tax=Opitutus sp. ER46 TaxID=2161864 RepID=UPI000D30531D|nr:sn-glycerol-1-phosphate dehydrogenase [Opitutus sp. ER46]PTX91830.1 3-dehydroquinate synthase [Opitutus sp. ER46]
MATSTTQLPSNGSRLTLAEALACANDTRALHVGPGVLRLVPEVFRTHFPGARAIIVADPRTFALAGQTVAAALAAAHIETLPPFIFTDPALYAEFKYVEQLEAALRLHDAIAIAVGSGTINDLTKLVTHRTGRPSYLCVGTAASMDGYTAFGASITFEGAKQTFNCPAPRAVVADTDILCQAPTAMTASGYADLFAKVPAGADWILADAIGAEPIDPRAWAIVQGGLRDALADPAGARAGKASALMPLVEGLMLGGFAMQWTKTSRPASGAEHQFSHLWDMEHHTHQGAAPSHGFKVGIATLAVTAFYEALLRQPLEQLDVEAAVARWPDAAAIRRTTETLFTGDEFLATAVRETQAKHVTPAELRTQLTRLRAGWPELRRRLQTQLIPFADARARLRAVGAPTDPREIGIPLERLRRTFIRAQFIRRRFTVLDLALRAGVTEACLDEIFGPRGPWAPAHP